MEPYLLYRDSSTDGKKSYAFPRDVVKDLNLDIIFKTMAKQDELIYEKARRVVLLPLTTPEEIIFRQEVLRDLRRPPGPPKSKSASSRPPGKRVRAGV